MSLASLLSRVAIGGAVVTGAAIVGGGIVTTNGLLSNDPNNVAGSTKFMGNYRFPLDLINSATGRSSYMNISFQRYQRRSIFTAPIFKTYSGIQLPIPANLTDSQSVAWNSVGAGQAVGAAIEGFLKDNPNSSTQGLSGLGGDKLQSLITAAGNGFAGKGVEAIQNLLGKDNIAQGLSIAGLAVNPFLSVLFQHPNFKSHQFTWELYPRNADESNTLVAIIMSLKSNMLPALVPSTGGIFMSYPNLAWISLYPRQEYLYSFKPAALTTMTADYAPNGPSFFKGTNAPTGIVLTLGFMEVEYWLKDDIENGGKTRANPNLAIFGKDGGLNLTPEPTPGSTPQ
jgi:hypothetical protein